jgi:hypothetical protein
MSVELAFATEAAQTLPSAEPSQLPSPSNATQLDALLDVAGTTMEEEHREHQLLRVLNRLTPILDELNSIQPLRDHDRQGAFAAVDVTGPARDTFARRQ